MKEEEIKSNIQDSKCENSIHTYIQIEMQIDKKIYALGDV